MGLVVKRKGPLGPTQKSLPGGGSSSSFKPKRNELMLAVAMLFIFSVIYAMMPGKKEDLENGVGETLLKEEVTNDFDQVPESDAVPSAAEYPIQDDEETLAAAKDIALEPEEEVALSEHKKELEMERISVIEDVINGVEKIQVGSFSTRVPSLGNLLFKDGVEYEAAENVFIPPGSLTDRDYSRMWYLQKLHDQFFEKNIHKRFIPRLDEPITKKQFHEIFRQTSTPVVIPFDHMRNLGVLTRGWTIAELREKFPYQPKAGAAKLNYGAKSGLSDKPIDLGPALYELERNAKLVRGAKGTTLRNFPRNLMIKPKYLSLLDITLPPFLPKNRFQVPTLWMGTTEADTKLHHDCCDNFVFMIAGVKRWFIAPPPDARNLRPIVCSGKHQSLCWAALKYPNKEDLTAGEKQMRDSLQYIIVDLQPGEMLYLPAGWYHHIENLEPTVMVNVWTRGCQNSAVALDNDPNRGDRPDFFSCARVARQTDEFINAM